MAIAVLAFAVRLVVVLHGGGLYGLGDYDDGVHYGAAVGLVHGLVPYRDFLFLHPPGIVLALSPFALFGLVVGDPNGFAAARLCWMGLGALSAALVVKILRPVGTVGALAGGVFYAVWYPAVYGDHTTQLEGLSTALALVAAALLTRPRGSDRLYLFAAGATLGASAGVKIWGVAIVAAFLFWVVATRGVRRGLWLAVGAVAGVTAVCLPFFLIAPATMWRMVVLDQLGRSRYHGLGKRVLDLVTQGSGHHLTAPTSTALCVIAIVVVALLAVLSLSSHCGRLALVWLVACGAVLVSTPAWFIHYASLAAGPMALVVGAGVGRLGTAAARRSPRVRRTLAVTVALALGGYAAPLLSATPGAAFPAPALRSTVASVPGCVTADDPTALVELNVLSRNLTRGCQLKVDLSGRSYDHPPLRGTRRARDAGWQHATLTYLRSGDLTMVTRFRSSSYLSRASRATVQNWPIVATAGKFSLRMPDAQPLARP